MNTMSTCLAKQVDIPKASCYTGLWHGYGKWGKISLWLHLATPTLSKASQVQIWENLSDSMPACLLHSIALVKSRWSSQWVEFFFWIYYVIIGDCQHFELRASASYNNITIMENFVLKIYVFYFHRIVMFISISTEKDSYTGIKQLSENLIPCYL